MTDPRTKAAEDLARGEGIDPQEAQELVDAILQNADFSQLPPEHQGPVDVQQTQQDFQYEQDPEEELLTDDMLDAEMEADQARAAGDEQAFRRASLKYREAFDRLQKRAIDMGQPGSNLSGAPSSNVPGATNPGGPGDQGGISCPVCNSTEIGTTGNTHECHQCGTQFDIPQMGNRVANYTPFVIAKFVGEDTLKRFANYNQQVVAEAFVKAARHTYNRKHLGNLMEFYLGEASERRVYAATRNLDSPLVCPQCSRKVARAKNNPMRFTCEAGHQLELNLDKVGGPDPHINPYDGGENFGEGYRGPNPDLNSPQESNPNFFEDQDQGPATPGTLSQDEKNRMNGVLYEGMSQAATPLFILGIADGFFETNLYEQLSVSQDEISEYQEGMKKGRAAKGGTTNIADF